MVVMKRMQAVVGENHRQAKSRIGLLRLTGLSLCFAECRVIKNAQIVGGVVSDLCSFLPKAIDRELRVPLTHLHPSNASLSFQTRDLCRLNLGACGEQLACSCIFGFG